MTAPSNDVLTNIESDNRASCTQRFHLEGRPKRKMARSHQPRSESPEASDFLPGLAKIPGPVSITRTRTTDMPRVLPAALRVFVPVIVWGTRYLSVACSPYDYLTLTYLFILTLYYHLITQHDQCTQQRWVTLRSRLVRSHLLQTLCPARSSPKSLRRTIRARLR